MVILAGTGSTAIFAMRHQYQFRLQSHIISGMLDDVRGRALSHVPSNINPQSIDTDFDGQSDTVPFAYVLELQQTSGNGVIARTYADFDIENQIADIYNSNPSGTDSLIEERVLTTGELIVSFTGKYDITAGALFTTPSNSNPRKTYSLAYSASDGTLLINEHNNASGFDQNVDLLSIHMQDPTNNTRLVIIGIFALSGAPFTIE